jgi:uncharacterized protein (TIGR02145 family)
MKKKFTRLAAICLTILFFNNLFAAPVDSTRAKESALFFFGSMTKTSSKQLKDGASLPNSCEHMALAVWNNNCSQSASVTEEVAAASAVSYGDTTATACGSFDWYEHTNITASGEYTHTFVGGSASGDDSVVTLHLTINLIPDPQIIVSPNQNCATPFNGKVIVTIDNYVSTMSYTVILENVDTVSDASAVTEFTGLIAGVYSYKVVNNFNCEYEDVVMVEQQEFPDLQLTQTPNTVNVPTYDHPANGTITILPPYDDYESGNFEYAYYYAPIGMFELGDALDVDNQSLTQTMFHLIDSLYFVVVQDLRTGCVVADTITVGFLPIDIVIDSKSCPSAPTVTDHEGNVYATVQIGNQCWMRENLRTTRYADGTSIPEGFYASSSTYPYYYNYGSSSIPLAERGYLYNWSAAMHGASSSIANPSGVQGVCPMGWHLPSDAEWTQLTNYMCGESDYICSSNTSHIAKALASATGWKSSAGNCVVGNDQNANNASGFQGVPAGHWDHQYVGFYETREGANFWSSTDSSNTAYGRNLCYYYSHVTRFSPSKAYGFSVRCLRDSVACGDIQGGVITSDTMSIQLCANQLPFEWNNMTLTESGIYVDTLQNIFGCDSVMDVLFLTVNMIPPPTGGSYDICNDSEATTMTLSVSRTNDIYNYSNTSVWFLGSDSVHTGDTYNVTLADIKPLFNVDKVVTYHVYAYNTATGCYSDDYSTVTVKFHQTPQIQVTYESTICPKSDDVGFTMQVISNQTEAPYIVHQSSDFYDNRSNELNNSPFNEMLTIYSKPYTKITDFECGNSYHLYYTVTDANGCVARDTATFTAIDLTAPDFVASTGSSIYQRLEPNRGMNCTFNSPSKAEFVTAFLGKVQDNCAVYDYEYLYDHCDFYWEKSSRFGHTLAYDSFDIFRDMADNQLTVEAVVWDDCGNADSTLAFWFEQSDSLVLEIVIVPQGDNLGQMPYCPNVGYIGLVAVSAVDSTFVPNLSYTWTTYQYLDGSSNSDTTYLYVIPDSCSYIYDAQVVVTDTLHGCFAEASILIPVQDQAPLYIGSEHFDTAYVESNGVMRVTDFTHYVTPATIDIVCGWGFNRYTIWQEPAVGTVITEETPVCVYITTPCREDTTRIFGKFKNIPNLVGPVIDEKSCPGYETVTDHEGNVYATVQIGNQCWMRDNLRTITSPSTGTYLIPPVGTDYTYTGKQARWYYNDSATYAPMNYGLLYNWNAAVDTFNTANGETSVNTDYNNAVSVTFSGHRRGICPTGWHLPSDAEWTILTDYVKSQAEYTCGGNTNYIAKALASKTGWNSYSGECYPGDQSVTENNATGFSAVPAGGFYGSPDYAGYLAVFWSSTQDANYPLNAYYRSLGYIGAYVGRGSNDGYKKDGYSVRCLRDSDANESTQGETIYIDTCDSFIWHGITYTASDTYGYSYTNADGYENVDILHLTIRSGTNSVETVIACDSYEWHGVTYYSSTTATFNTVNAQGCDSIVTLHLTVLHSDTVEMDSVVCENELPLTWHGVTFNAAGTQTLLLSNVYGCDSVVVMNLTVEQVPQLQLTATEPVICAGGATVIAAEITGGNNGDVNYNWSNSYQGSTYTFTPAFAGSYTFVVTASQSAAGCVVADSIVINVNELPATPQVALDNAVICDGGQVTLTVTNAVSNAVYSWYRNGVVIPGATAPVLIESLVTVDGNASNYSYTVSSTLPMSGCTSLLSANTIVTVIPTPVVAVSVEGGTTLCVGGSTTLHANVIPPNANYSYQWYKDNVPILGATTADYIAIEVARENIYNYSVVVSSNPGCNVTAYAPAITFVADPVVEATISNNISCAGGTATLTATVTGGVADVNGLNGYSFQWYNNVDPTTPVSTMSSFTISGNEAVGDYYYWVTAISNYGCQSTSNPVAYSVIADPVVTIAVAQGYPQTVCDGGASMLTANVTGGYGEAAYQWYKNGNLLVGETNRTLNLASLAYGDNDIYTVEVTQTGGSCANYSSVALNTLVTVAPSYTVDITGNGNVCEGGSLTLTAYVSGVIYGDVLSYQWYRITNGIVMPISGANSAQYQTSNLLLSGSYDYYVEVSSCISGCSVSSPIVPANVVADPTVTITGANTVCQGGELSLNAFVIDSDVEGAAYTYIWNWFGAATGSATTAVPTFVPTVAANNAANPYYFTVSVSRNDNTGCNATSVAHEVNVLAVPTVSVTADNSYVCPNGNVTFTAHVSPVGFYNYVWTINGQQQALNANTITTSIANIGTITADVVVSTVSANASCSAMATIATPVQVVAAPTVTISADHTTMCVGGTTTLTSNISANNNIPGEFNYQWAVNDVEVSDAVANTFVQSPNTAGVYVYTLRVFQDDIGCSSAWSAPVTVQVAEQPVVTLTSADSLSICEGGSITMTGVVTNYGNTVNGVTNSNIYGALTFDWTFNGVNVHHNTNVINAQNQITEILNTVGDYSYQVTVGAAGYNCLPQASNIHIVNVVDDPSWAEVHVYSSNGAGVCLGDTVTLSAVIQGGVVDENGNTGGLIQWTVLDENGNTMNVCGGSGGFSYDIPGAVGTYTYIPTYFGYIGNGCQLTNTNGNLNTDSLMLTVNTSSYNILVDTVVENALPYTCNGQEYFESGTYYQTLTNVAGCDSLLTLNLTVLNNVWMSFDTTVCDSYEWNGVNYTQSGDYTQLFSTVYGTDSTVTLHLTINYSNTGDTVAVACDRYDWYEYTNLTQSGDYTHTFMNAAGCDSIVTLHLTLKHSEMAEYAETACDSYIWNDSVYTQSGDYVQTFTNAEGCDSVVTLHLTVNYSNTGDTTAVACDSYDWYEHINLTQSGDYTRTFTNAAGCDSVVTLHLTVNYSNTGDTTAIACDSYDWYEHANLTQNGDYMHTFTNAAGCDSVVTLHLTVNYSNTGDTTAVACDSYDWYEHTNLTQSGDYTQTFTAANGCDSVVTLHLTVKHTVTEFVDATTCGNYEWNDSVYTQSGDYTQTFTAANGCDSVVTLHLTVNSVVTEFVEATACDSYEWNDIVYTQSGDYTQTFTAANGCDSVVTLHLTVNHTVTEFVEAAACDSYEWNDIVYTQSGDYPLTLTAANGCDSVVTLQLTLNYSEMAEFVETACDGYIWNDSVYTQSGDYVRTFTNINGCDSVVTLHLTINPTQASEFTVTTEDSCYIWNDQIYCMSGDYAQALQTIHGCDSIVTLHLTITVGIDGHDLGAALMLYPNPTTGLLNVRCTGCNELLTSVDIQVFDAYGKILQTVPMTSEATQLDLSHYADGIYFVKAVKDGQAFAVRKVVKN